MFTHRVAELQQNFRGGEVNFKQSGGDLSSSLFFLLRGPWPMLVLIKLRHCTRYSSTFPMPMASKVLPKIIGEGRYLEMENLPHVCIDDILHIQDLLVIDPLFKI
jgi:hypothetical protein